MAVSTKFSISNSFTGGELWKVTDGTFDSNQCNATANTINSSMLTVTDGNFLNILSVKITDNNIGQNIIDAETNDITNNVFKMNMYNTSFNGYLIKATDSIAQLLDADLKNSNIGMKAFDITNDELQKRDLNVKS